MSKQPKGTSDMYEYVDEKAIDEDLVCNICRSPFKDPRNASCDHVFCRKCITQWIEMNNVTCPLCRKALSIQDLALVPHPLRNMVDKLRVMCKICGKSDLSRGDFDDHIEKVCPKIQVSCLLTNVKCSWTGCRDELNKHLDVCTHIGSLRPIIEPYIAENKKLRHQETELKVQIHKYHNEIHQLTSQISQLKKENDRYQNEYQHIKNQETRMSVQIRGQQGEIHHLKDQLVQLKADNTKHSSRNRRVLRSASRITNIGIQNGTTVAGGKYQGKSSNQLNNPHGLYVHDDQTMYIADYANHRILEWKCGTTNGHVIAGKDGQGILETQLNFPTDMVFDKVNDSFIISDRGNGRIVRCSRRNSTDIQIMLNVDRFGLALDDIGHLYVSSYNNHEVRRYEAGDKCGTVVAGGRGQGDHRNQLSYPTSIFVDRENAVYVSDSYNHRIMKWSRGAHEGLVVAGGRGQGASLKQLSFPHGVTVDQSGTVYVADSDNHRIMRWSKGAALGAVLAGGNERGSQANQLNFPMALSFDQQGNLYVSDRDNHRVQTFKLPSVILEIRS